MQASLNFSHCYWVIPKPSHAQTRRRGPLSFETPLRISATYRASLNMAASSSSPEWVSFPYLSSSGKRLMQDVADAISSELSGSLNPTQTPADVRHFKNSEGNCEGSVTLRSGTSESSIDFVLGSWLHCNLPFGTLNISTVIGMINHKIDSPHLLFEFIQTGTNNLVVVLDLLPRKDLVLDPDYLKQYYEDKGLESVRQELQKSPHAKRYEPPTLYIRCVTSPTAIMYTFESTEEKSLDTIIEEIIYPVAKKVIKVWLDTATTTAKVTETDVQLLLERDKMIKTKGVEVDLSSNMPRLFGQDIANRVVEAFRKGK